MSDDEQILGHRIRIWHHFAPRQRCENAYVHSDSPTDRNCLEHFVHGNIALIPCLWLCILRPDASAKVLVAWFTVVFLLPYMFHPDMILQGLCPHQSFVTNVACAVVFGNIFKNRSRFVQLCNFARVNPVHSQ